MTQDIIRKIQESFADGANLSSEKLQEFVQETLQVFRVIQNKMNSKEPGDREEAVLIATQLKDTFEKQAEKLDASIDVDPEQLMDFMENSGNFSQKEWETISMMKKEINEFRKQSNPNKKSPKMGKKNNRVRLMG